MSITVVIPTFPQRARGPMLGRALRSVWAQELLPSDVIVALDLTKSGGAATRDQGLAQVRTEWVAFLDDDDEFQPWHLRVLAEAAEQTGADYLYPWFDVGSGGTDPFTHEGEPFDPSDPKQIPVTVLARTEVVRAAGGYSLDYDPDRDYGQDGDGNRQSEDFRIIARLLDVGAKIHHVPVRTWVWHHHASNTTGLPSRQRR